MVTTTYHIAHIEDGYGPETRVEQSETALKADLVYSYIDGMIANDRLPDDVSSKIRSMMDTASTVEDYDKIIAAVQEDSAQRFITFDTYTSTITPDLGKANATLTDAEKDVSRTARVTQREDGVLKVQSGDQHVYLTLTGEKEIRVEAVNEEGGAIQIENRNDSRPQNVNLTFPAQ